VRTHFIVLNEHLCQVAIDIPTELVTSSMVFRDAAEGPIVCGLTQLHASNSVAGSLGENVVLTPKSAAGAS
jgi:hypothetical protein